MSNAKIFAEGVLLDSENWTRSNIEITNRYHKSWNHHRNYSNNSVPPLNQVPSYIKQDHKKKLINSLCLSDQWEVTPHQIEVQNNNNFIEKNQQGSFPSKIILSESDTCSTENTGKYHLGQPLKQHFDLPAGEIQVSIQTLINTANADRTNKPGVKTYDSLIITGKQAISNPDLENAKWMNVNKDSIDEISLKAFDTASHSYIVNPEITTDDIKTAIESYDYKPPTSNYQENSIEQISSVVVHPADNSNGVFIRKDGSRHPMFKIVITSVFGIEKTDQTNFRKVAPFHDSKPCPCCCDCDGCQEFGIHKPSYNRFNFERKLTVVTPRIYVTNFAGELVRSGPDGKEIPTYKKIKSTIKMDLGNYEEDKVIAKTKGKIDKPKKDILKNMVVRDKRRRKNFRKPFNKQVSYE